jgi:hypothetical protein
MKNIFTRLLPVLTVLFIGLSAFSQERFTDSVLMTFRCNMKIEILSHNFNPVWDYLNIAGNFNKYSKKDTLFDLDNDSIYTLEQYIDTSVTHGLAINFKFSINGDTMYMELKGKPDRTYDLHEPTAGDPNLYSCTFDNKTYSQPSATDLLIQGQWVDEQIVTGAYLFVNPSGIAEGESLYQWYRADSIDVNVVAIDTATKINYTIDTLDVGKYLVFEVTPIALGGDSAIGLPSRVYTNWPIGGVGITEHGTLVNRIYPNPATAFIAAEITQPAADITLLDMRGMVVRHLNGAPGILRIDLNGLAPGLYVLRVTGENGQVFSGKVIKQ